MHLKAGLIAWQAALAAGIYHESQAQRKPIRRATRSGRVSCRRIMRRSTIENAVRKVGQLMTQAKISVCKDSLS
jgi:hypothetical protein